jgi:hypothetical protein
MIRKLLPVLLALLGLGIGLGAGFALRPGAAPAAHDAAPVEDAGGHGAEADPHAPAPEAGAHGDAAAEGAAQEYVKLTNQFVVPLLEGGKVSAMVILSLSVEVKTGQTADVYTKEPKLRDSFLQVMFNHANAGGFDGPFTDSANMIALRRALLESARQTLGESAQDVLITDIVRQDTRS